MYIIINFNYFCLLINSQILVMMFKPFQTNTKITVLLIQYYLSHFISLIFQ